MNLLEIACIVFSCVAASHLELVAAIEKILHRRLPIVSCPKCCTFWAVIIAEGCCDTAAYMTGEAAYMTGEAAYVAGEAIATAVKAVATAFAAAWAAAWVELAMGAIDRLYLMAYGKIYAATDTADADTDGADDALPDVRGEEDCNTECRTDGGCNTTAYRTDNEEREEREER
jgi:hypothetical protein